MRRLIVTMAFIASLAVWAPTAQAGNQEEANRIAKSIQQAYPQYSIEVAYKKGEVRLRGKVNNEADKNGILQLVQNVPNVQSVQETFVIANTADSSVMPVASIQSPKMADQYMAVPAAETVSDNYASQLSPVPEYNNIVSVSASNTLEQPITQTSLQGLNGQAAEPFLNESFEFSNDNSTAIPMEAQNVPATQDFRNYPASNANYSPAPQGTPIPTGQNGQKGAPNLPNYAWPSTADYPNYSQVSYPKQYSASSFPYIGPFYPYPQVPLGWRKVTMEWHDGYWWLDFNDGSAKGPFSPLFRQPTKYR